jgi:hypothetical protein
MDVKTVKSTRKEIRLQISISINEKDMLTKEEAIQKAVNEAGKLATHYVLSRYDTDGSPVKVGKEKYTSKGKVTKLYQCPAGATLLLEEMRGFLKKKITNEKKEEILRAITYFSSHLHQMKYDEDVSKNLPIGSGVISRL